MNKALALPEWVDIIAIDPDGEVWAFEGDAFFDGKGWHPIDDYDGLFMLRLGATGHSYDPGVARTLYFRRVREGAPAAPADEVVGLLDFPFPADLRDDAEPGREAQP